MNIRYIPNLLNKSGRVTHKVEFSKDKTIRDYVLEAGLKLEEHRVIVRGKVVKDYDQKLSKPVEIIVSPDVKDPVTLFYAAVSYYLLYQSVINAVLFLALVGFSVFSALQRPRKPNFGTVGSGKGGLDESSPTYGWDGIKTTQNIGTPIPVVYGTHKVGGNIINQYVNADGDKNYLNMLIALCEGEVDDITEIKINDNPIANYDGITQAVKYGTNSQTVIPNFEDLHNLNNVNVNLNELNDDHIFTTIDNDVEGFDVHLTFAGGLSSQDPTTGSINSHAVGVKVEYRVSPAGGWSTLFDADISGNSRSAIRRVISKTGLTPAQYDIRVTRTTPVDGQYEIGQMEWTYLDETKTDDLTYPNTALLGIRALATDQLSGGSPNVTCVVRGRKVSVPDIRLSMGGASVDWDDYYWKPDDSTWRLLDGDTILYWDGTTFVDAYSANPVWCIRDLLTNTRFGLGEFILEANIDDDLFLEMAKYADEKVADGSGGYEKRFMLDAVIDSSTRSLDAIIQLLATFRGMVFFSNGTVKLRIDKPDSQSQIFTMGNIIKDSFSQTWKSAKESFNVAEVQYIDKTKNYEQELVAYIDESALEAGDILRKHEFRIFCTRVSQALREARYSINIAKHIHRTISFKASTDALAVQAGDVIGFSHDVPQWGYSGRVQSGSTTSSVVLDRTVTVAPATTYKLKVRFADDTIEERTVSNSTGDHSTITVSPAFSQAPASYDVYAFGVENVVVKPFRVMGIERESKTEVLIRAVEYNADIYDDSAPEIPTDNYSALERSFPDVTNLNAIEGVQTALDGTVVNFLDVYWQKPDDSDHALEYRFKGVKIYLSDDGGTTYVLRGYSEGINFKIFDIDADKTYYVKAVTVVASGAEDSLSGAPTDSVTTVGKTEKPANVSGFAYQFIKNQVKLYWNANDEADVGGYEIREVDSNWGVDDSGRVFVGLQTEITFEVDSRTAPTYYIRAFNRSGQYSNASVSVTPTNTAPSAIIGLGADVFFNVANLYWDNSSDIDVEKYQIYKSETNAWAGEESLVTEAQGKSAVIEGRKPRQGIVTSATSTTVFRISSLIGFANDYFNGDKIYFSNGSNLGLERTITDFDGTTGEITVNSALTATPSVDDRVMIFDIVYVKVRAVDFFGVGTFSSAYQIEFEGVDENMFDDGSITPRKMFVAELSAISANMGCLTAGTITGATFQTATGGQRLRFNSSGLYGYNAGGDERLRISTDGSIKAVDVCLYDPANCCNYSYLSAGSWYHHDSLGNSTPYPKRIDCGVANAGDTLVFCGWCCAPKIIVGIQALRSYDASYPASCQQWCVYADTPVYFCTSATCWGWCTAVHASLIKSTGLYAESVKDINFATSTYTALDACSTRVRLRFQLWASSSCSTDNYCYGYLSYKVRYKCCSSGVWCECSYTYTQAHANQGELQSNADVCHDIDFGTDYGCFEIQATCTSLTWCVSSLPQTTLTACCRTFTACVGQSSSLGSFGEGGFEANPDADLTCVSIGGTAPSNVQCNIFCINHSSCVFARGVEGNNTPEGYAYSSYEHRSYAESMCSRSIASCYSNNQSHSTGGYVGYAYTMPSCYNACSFLDFCLCTTACSGDNGQATYACTTVCGCLIQCYYPTVSANTCELKKLYSLLDCAGAFTVLDGAGVLNWLAVGYG